MEEQLWYGKYQPVELLSAGNGTEVFLVEHAGLHLKRILKRADKGTFSEYLLRHEASLLGKINSPSVPALFDLEETAGELALIIEYIDGDSLAAYLKQSKSIDLQRIIDIVTDLCEILMKLQADIDGFVHCDLQPANLILRNERLCLIDFGASFSRKEQAFGNFYGTKGFCAPEQESGGTCDERTDIYALGKLLLYMLDFAAGTFTLGEKVCKKRLLAIAEKAIADKPEERFSTVDQLKSALLRCRGLKCSGYKPGLPKRKAVCTIGIAGTHRGVGVTHTAISMAWYLSNVEKMRVAVIELSESKALSCFSSVNSNGTPCRVAGFDVFPAADSLLVGAVRNGNYDYCILDLGCAGNKRLQELLRCDKKLILSDSAPWRQNRRGIIEDFLANTKQPDDWWLIFNLSGRTRPDDCRHLPVNVEWMQYSPDPMSASVQNNRMYGKILSAN